MRNTILYPTNYEVKKAIEEIRKRYAKKMRVKISQEKFATIISPSLVPKIKDIKLKEPR